MLSTTTSQKVRKVTAKMILAPVAMDFQKTDRKDIMALVNLNHVIAAFADSIKSTKKVNLPRIYRAYPNFQKYK